MILLLSIFRGERMNFYFCIYVFDSDICFRKCYSVLYFEFIFDGVFSVLFMLYGRNYDLD